MTSHAAQPAPAHPVADTLGAAVAGLAIVVAVVGIAWKPAILTPIAVALSLAAVIMSARWRRFAAVAVAVAGLAWFVGMIVAVIDGHPLY